MTANLAKVQKLLGGHVGKEINMMSITVDPTVDTPAVLKRYADRFGVQAGWCFLTGAKQDVDLVLKEAGRIHRG